MARKNVSLSLDLSLYNRSVKAICAEFGYQPKIKSPDDTGFERTLKNPETKNQFVARMIVEKFFKDISVKHEIEEEMVITRKEKKSLFDGLD